jgi:hypothetical protein
MSAIEAAVKPILTPLITSQPHDLTIASIKVLSQWITLKIMVAERNRPESAVTPAADRAKFRSTLEIPAHLKIWIAQVGGEAWETGYFRHAATVSTSPIVTAQHRFKNIHSVAFGIGDLFVYVLHTTVAGVLNSKPEHSANVVPVHPEVGSYNWPPPRRLAVDDANAIASSLVRHLRGPSIRWAPGFPY